MSINTALSNALSGLNAAARGAELVSNNVANALTPGYTRRTLELTTAIVNGNGAGVRVAAIRLEMDPVVLASRRRTDADLGFAASRGAALARIVAALGTPDAPGALATRAAEFETALNAAANDPASSAGLSNLVAAGNRYASTINQISTETRRMRMDADGQIARQVGEVNASLRSIEALNREIKIRAVVGGDAAALMDQRQRLIDQVSSILPIRTVQRDNNEIAIFTTSGATLIDGPASELGFTRTSIITPDMTLASGALSGLTLNGRPVTIGDGTGKGPLDGGSLSELFEQRDVVLPAFSDQLDGLAADLIARFEDPSVDPTLAPGDAGLFTDGGAPYSAADQTGLAGRIALNAIVDPSRGGELWRLRDGLNAVTPGNSGSSAILVALNDAMTSARAVPSGFGVTQPMSAAGLAAELSSQIATQQYQADSRSTYLAALNSGLRESESAISGVDTDTEMQKLLLVEQAYSANARVISVIDGLLQRVLEI